VEAPPAKAPQERKTIAKRLRMRARTPKEKPAESPKAKVPLRAKVETPETTASILIFSRRKRPGKR